MKNLYRNFRRSPIQSSRPGATAIVVVIMLPVLMLIIGFSVDLAYMQLSRAELRAATDLAAKAASAELSASGSETLARDKGKQVASANTVAGEALTLDNSDFVFGNTTSSSSANWSFTANATPTNAVQVNGRRTALAPDGEVELFFSGLMNGGGFATTADATAGFINADICLVLDRSSSMKLAVTDPATGMSGGDPRQCDTPWADSRWVALDNAVNTFVTKMNATLSDEQVAVVTFASDNTTCSEKSNKATLDQPLTPDLTNVTSAMATLSSTVWNGNTEISEGMKKAISELKNEARPTAQRVMIVLTDGAYTDGVHPQTEAVKAVNEDIRVHTITFGSCPASVITDMQDTAIAGGGNHYHAPDAATLNVIFSEIAGSISILTQ